MRKRPKMFYALLRSHDWEIKTFPDVPASKWYADPVGTMATLGIVGGYENGAFRPDQQITRAEFVKMAVSFDTIQDGELIFPDVSPSSWAVPYIVTATQNGWINGYKDGFHPEDRITRSEAVTIINRMLGRSPDAEILSLTDTKNLRRLPHRLGLRTDCRGCNHPYLPFRRGRGNLDRL